MSNADSSPPRGDGPPPPWWTGAVDDVVRRLDADAIGGLTPDGAVERRRMTGWNELAEQPPISLWRRVVDQCNELIVWILVAAAAISAVIGDWLDAAAILAIVILNVAIGVFQEERAGRALAALRKLAAPTVRVIRAGSLQSIPAREIVTGDLLQLEAGDHVAADARLVKSFGCRMLEAALTGESTPVDKDAEAALHADAPLADRRNMVYAGTALAAGRAVAVVVATGMATELGQIAGLLQEEESEPTPLQRRLAALGRVLIIVCLAVVAAVFALNLYRGGAFLEVLLIAISLAVAAVPEGLPAVVTLTLAVGLGRMVHRHALIRKLPSVETLGAVTVICSDKTGTLTRNEMTVREIVAGRRHYHVTGVGYSPTGEFVPRSSPPSGDAPLAERSPVEPVADGDLAHALTVAVRCNAASLQAPDDGADAWRIVGDPTEGALLVAARKAGIASEAPGLERLHEIPFDSERKAMSVVVRGPDARPVMYTKGAPEVVLPNCTAERCAGAVEPLSAARRHELRALGADMASRALRVLALAYREHHAERGLAFEEEELVFAGLIGMIDPPRAEAIEAVRRCRAAGIRPVMITGDHPETALAIAREVGIARPGDRLVTGVELDELPDDLFSRDVATIAVYARVSAKHKLRVVEAWQRRGDVVAMTGDGVNDAPAVHAADIGVAMGITGADVTKEAADMVLTDDNFASIVSAVEEGRGIFDNIQKVVHYLLACNSSEVLLMVLAGLAGWPPPLSALQILWINLITDGLPALALGREPAERNVMDRPPRPLREQIITWPGGLRIVCHGLLMVAASAVVFWRCYQGDPGRLLLAQSAVFCTVAYSQLFYSVCCRSSRDTAPQAGFLANPYLIAAILASAVIQFLIVATPAARAVFAVDAGVLTVWPLIAIASLIPATAIEIAKLTRRDPTTPDAVRA